MSLHLREIISVVSECGSEPADFVFLLDSSASEGAINFQKQIDFVRDFVYQFQIGPADVQVLSLYSIDTHFLRITKRQLLKTLWEKKKLLVKSNFFFSHNVFCSIR